MTSPPAVLRVVVVNFNGGQLVEDCVQSLLDQRPVVGVDEMSIVVVDNASHDGSAEALEERFGRDVMVLRNPVNAGFVAANVGMSRIDGLPDPRWVALVNPDATLAEGCLAALVEAVEADPGIGAASPCMVFTHQFVDLEVESPPSRFGGDPRPLAVQVRSVVVDGVERLHQVAAGPGVHDPEHDSAGAFRWLAPQATLGVPVGRDAAAPIAAVGLWAPEKVTAVVGGETVTVGPQGTTVTVPLTRTRVDRIANAGSLVFDDGSGADRGHFAVDGPPFDEATDVFVWCGGGVLLRWDYLRDVGTFEPSLFLYYEDTDLAWRGASRGWRHRYVPKARMFHVQGASGGAGSDRFVVSNTRNRLVVTVRNASWRVVRRAWVDTVWEIWAALRNRVVVPALHGRRPSTHRLALLVRGMGGAVGALPAALGARRRLARRATVGRDVLESGLVPRRGRGAK